jgi:hypothetical protein
MWSYNELKRNIKTITRHYRTKKLEKLFQKSISNLNNNMKKSQLKQIIREILNEELALESKVSDAAKAQGLEYFGFGRYGTGGRVTHVSQGGKLVPKQSFKPDDVNRRGRVSGIRSTARSSRPSVPTRASADVVVHDPLTNRLGSVTAGANREYQKTFQDLRRVTGATNFDDPLLKDKGFTQQGDLGYTDVRDPSTRRAPFPRVAQRAVKQISDKAVRGFGDAPRNTPIDLETFVSRSGLTPTEIKFADKWNKKYGFNYNRVPFKINNDGTVTRISR